MITQIGYLNFRYVMALCLIALLCISAYSLITVTLYTQESDAPVINYSGRQRMLSQKLTKEALLLAQSPTLEMREKYRWQVGTTTVTWSSVHNGLQFGDKELRLPGENSKEIRAFFAEMKPYYHIIKNSVDSIVSLEPIALARLSPNSTFIQDIVKASSSYLKLMDNAVFQYEREAQSRIDLLRRYQTYILAIILIVLAIEALFIFRPMVNKVRRSFEELRKTNEELTREIIERKLAEEALIESEERFKSVFENTAIGLYRTAPDGRILMANPALIRMLGFSSFEQLAQRNLQEEGYKPRYERPVFVRRIESEGQIVGLESCWTRRDGSKLFVRENATAIRDKAGNTIFYEGSIEDITERKQAEKAIQALVRSMIGTTGKECFDNIVSELCKWFDADCALIGQIAEGPCVKTLSMQSQGEKIYNYTYRLQATPCEEVATKNCFCHYPERVQALFPDDEDLVKLSAEGYVGAPIRDRNGDVIGILCVISSKKLNLSERSEEVMNIIATRAASEIGRKQAEDAVRESEKKYRALVEKAGVGIVVDDTAGN